MARTSRITALISLTAAAALAVTLSGCQTGTGTDTGDDTGSGYVTDGKLTIATGEPAYYPWVIDDKPESGEGFESAIAYAVADQLGFDKSDVVWVRSTFEDAIAPGPKDYDFNLQQISITDDRKANIDFSSAYYETTQVVITTNASAAAGAKSLADLKPLLIGAQVGTTSFDAIEQQIAPDQGAQREEHRTAQGAHRRDQQRDDQHPGRGDQQHPDVEQQAHEHRGKALEGRLRIEERVLHDRPARGTGDPDPEQHGEHHGAGGADQHRSGGLPATKDPALQLKRAGRRVDRGHAREATGGRVRPPHPPATRRRSTAACHRRAARRRPQ